MNKRQRADEHNYQYWLMRNTLGQRKIKPKTGAALAMLALSLIELQSNSDFMILSGKNKAGRSSVKA